MRDDFPEDVEQQTAPDSARSADPHGQASTWVMMTWVAPQVVAVLDSVSWNPNAPEARLVVDEASASLELRPRFDDPDQRNIRIRWLRPVHASMGAPNDEARHLHPLNDHGVRELLWAGEVLNSAIVA